MSIRTLIDGGLQYLARRHDMAKNVSRQRTPIGSTNAVCGACGSEIVQVNERGTRVCWKCGKKAQ